MMCEGWWLFALYGHPRNPDATHRGYFSETQPLYFPLHPSTPLERKQKDTKTPHATL